MQHAVQKTEPEEDEVIRGETNENHDVRCDTADNMEAAATRRRSRREKKTIVRFRLQMHWTVIV